MAQRARIRREDLTREQAGTLARIQSLTDIKIGLFRTIGTDGCFSLRLNDKTLGTLFPDGVFLPSRAYALSHDQIMDLPEEVETQILRMMRSRANSASGNPYVVPIDMFKRTDLGFYVVGIRDNRRYLMGVVYPDGRVWENPLFTALDSVREADLGNLGGSAVGHMALEEPARLAFEQINAVFGNAYLEMRKGRVNVYLKSADYPICSIARDGRIRLSEPLFDHAIKSFLDAEWGDRGNIRTGDGKETGVTKYAEELRRNGVTPGMLKEMVSGMQDIPARRNAAIAKLRRLQGERDAGRDGYAPDASDFDPAEFLRYASDQELDDILKGLQQQDEDTG